MRHGCFDLVVPLGRGKAVEVALRGHFDIDAEAVSVPAGLGQKFPGCAGDPFQVDITGEAVLSAKFAATATNCSMV